VGHEVLGCFEGRGTNLLKRDWGGVRSMKEGRGCPTEGWSWCHPSRTYSWPSGSIIRTPQATTTYSAHYGLFHLNLWIVYHKKSLILPSFASINVAHGSYKLRVSQKTGGKHNSRRPSATPEPVSRQWSTWALWTRWRVSWAQRNQRKWRSKRMEKGPEKTEL